MVGYYCLMCNQHFTIFFFFDAIINITYKKGEYISMNNDIFEKLTQDVNTSANIGVNQDIYVGENFIAKGGILNATELKNEVPENNAEY